MSKKSVSRNIRTADTMREALDYAYACCAQCMHDCEACSCMVEAALMDRAEVGSMTAKEKAEYFDFVGDR